MSTTTPVEYDGVSGVANSGGDSLTQDLNIYYSVRSHAPVDGWTTPPASPMPLTPSIIGRRCRMDNDQLGPRVAHGPGCRFLLQRSCAPQVSAVSDLAVVDLDRRGWIPMVLLGLLAHLLPHGKRLHR